MKRNVLLFVLLIFLMVMNGVLLYLVMQKPDRKIQPPKSFISERLDFNKEQLTEFSKYEREHRQKMRYIEERSRELKEILFSNIGSEESKEMKIDSIGALIGTLEKEREIEVFDHFRQIESICDEDQKQQLKRILNGAFGPRRPDGRPPNDGPPPPR